MRGDQDGRGGPRRPTSDAAKSTVIFHTDRGSTYTAHDRSPGCVPESRRFASPWAGSDRVSTMPPPRRSSPPGMGGPVPPRFGDTRHAQAVVLDWCYGFYNHDRRHSSADMHAPVNYEIRAPSPSRKPHRETLHDLGGTAQPSTCWRSPLADRRFSSV